MLFPTSITNNLKTTFVGNCCYSTYSWTVLIENLKWNGHIARRLDGVAVVQHPARMADLRDLLDRKQHSGFIVRPHERHDSRVIGDPASRSARVP